MRHCKTPYKIQYLTRQDAEENSLVKGVQLKTYFCDGCKHWHNTSEGISPDANEKLHQPNRLKYFKKFKALLRK